MRISEAQAKLLFGHPAAPRSRPSKPRTELPENQLESQVLGYLRAKGWIVTRNQVGTYVPYYVALELGSGKALNHANVVRIGEKGQADYTCMRPVRDQSHVQYFHLEVKARGRRLRPEQERWIARQRAVGIIAMWFDDFVVFKDWYSRTYSP